MDLTSANLTALFTTFATVYASAYKGTAPWWSQIATLMPSTSESVTHGWLDRIPKLREWIGPRQVQNAKTRDRIVTNKTFELTAAVPKEKIEDDQYGVYSPLAAMFGQQAAKWPDQLLAAKIVENPVGFDGVTFFNDAHPTFAPDGSTYDNNLALPLTAANYGTARAAMMQFKGADGEPLQVMPNLLVVPPQLEQVAREILNNEFLPSAAGTATTQNVWRGSAQLLVIPELTAATTWYLLDVRNVIKPFIFQLRQAPNFVYRNKPTDDAVFWNRELIFGVDARGVSDVSLPFLALRSVG